MNDLPPVHEASSPGHGKRHGVQIVTGSRLHFGLLNTVDPFGGVGVMLESPATRAIITEAKQFDYRGPQPARAREIASRIARATQHAEELPCCRIDVFQYAPPHCGLGSGTQLSLTIAEGVCCCLGIDMDHATLSTHIAARGKRSAVGVHGYFHGGLIYEASDGSPGLNRIQHRVDLPSDWCVAILHHHTDDQRVHGRAEVEHFATLPRPKTSVESRLRNLVCDELMPAAVAGDFEAFSSSVHHYNRESGMLFASVQGGIYNGPGIEELVQWLLERGVTGVGQSSWGPGVFAWFESPAKAEPIVRRLPEKTELITLTRVRNQGRSIEPLP